MTRTLLLSCLLAGACGVATERTEEDVEDIQIPRQRLVQPGAGLLLLEVTDDNHAIYQDGQQVFATSLVTGAEPEPIGEVPAGNVAFAFHVGKVVFVWTNPDRTLPSFGVGPLVIWSARGGAHLASDSSPVGTLATTASADGEQILFTANGSADGTTGDLVLASADLAERRTLAAGIPMGFPAGPCVPRATFIGDSGELVATYCAAGASTATLSRWSCDGEQHDLAEPLLAPPRLRVDPDRQLIATILADSRPATVDRRDRVTVVADVAAVNAFFAGDGAVLYATVPDPAAPAQLFRVRSDRPPRHVAAFLGIYFFATGSRSLAEPIGSPDGRKLAFFDTLDPTTGASTDVRQVKLREDADPVTLDTAPFSSVFGPPFTRDSRHTLFTRVDQVFFAVGPMFAAGPSGTRQFSDDNGWQWDAAFGSTVTYNDHTAIDPNNFFLNSTADLRTVDLARSTLEPRLIAEQANVSYLASHRGGGVVYTTDHAAEPGLYVARVR